MLARSAASALTRSGGGAFSSVGVTEDELVRLHAPIGLSIGSRSPEEIALSIMAQIVATRNGVDFLK